MPKAASLSPEPVTVTAIRLHGLDLSRFKGIRSFSLSTGGEDVAVYGDNAAGKTSLADAFAWLLFGKDSAGKADFELKTLGPNGEALHGLDHEVCASLTVGERPLELRKVYREKWQKRRGSADREFTGHTTDHFVNGVPCKEKEYQSTVAEIADEAVIRLLTDPAHFAERLHWQDRRKILLEVCGDVPDSEVIASTKALAELPEILAGRSIDDHRKVGQSRKKSINAELQRVPVRIDEVSRGLDGLAEAGDEKTIRSKLAGLREQKAELESRRARIASGGEIAEQTKRLREIESEFIAEKNKAGAAASEKAAELRAELSDRQSRLDEAKREAAKLYGELKDADDEIASLETRMDERRAQWHEIDAETFSPADGAETCAACGQQLPAERVKEARSKALAVFNAEKSRRLEELVSEGKRLRARADELRGANEERGAALKAAEKRGGELASQVDALRADFVNANARAELPLLGISPRQEELEVERHRIELEIEHLRDRTADAREKADSELGDLNDHITAVEADLARIEQRRAAEKRVNELRKEERRLAAEFEGLERELYLLEEFTRRKVSMLTDRINGRFELARFRLFETQINGSLSEVCEVSYGGVPWGSLNHGSRVKVGLDIIRTLQRHYGIAPCIWIDQSESVTRLPEMDCQVIRLVVSEADKTLRVKEA